MKKAIADTIRKQIMAMTDDELIAFALDKPAAKPKLRSKPAATQAAEPDDDEEQQRVWTTLNKEQRGLSSGELALMCVISQPRLRTVLKRLVAAGQAFVHGERKFARYAVSAEMAEHASLLAQGKQPGEGS
ncbi:hypothetical protein KKA53_05410 [Candidatus Dependentiae bacterium]|nr:hypothetical protein [Candidatus Dependentiae bacterium]